LKRAIARLLDGKRRQTTLDFVAFAAKKPPVCQPSIAPAHGRIPWLAATAATIALTAAST
jgi:hypothetical protein